MAGYIAFARKQLSLTSLLSTAFIAYMSFSFYSLYRVAVPIIPPLHRPDGSLKPLLRPLWSGRSFALELHITHSSPATPLHDTDNSMLIYRWPALPHNASLHADLNLVFHIESDSNPNASCSSCNARPAPPNAQLPHLPPFPAPAPVSRLVVTCDGCGAVSATGARDRYSSPILHVATGRAAERIGRAIQRGGNVFATVTASLHDDSSSAVQVEEYLKSLLSSTPLTAMAEYSPPKQLRFLWRDVTGVATRAMYLNASVNGCLPANGQLLRRSRGEEQALYGRDLKAMPLKGEVWPHWLGQLDIKLVMESDDLPRDDLPPAVSAYLRTDAGRTIFAPLLTANPVRPTKERFHPLNVTVSSLPLRVTVAPLSHGSWQLLRVLDSAINTQKSMGASDADTDDVIRMFAETPIVLLAVTLVVSCVHVLFDVLAFKNDVAFWATASTLRGISVRSLSVQFGSQAVISAYLWSEGASLLVLVPQIAFTALQLFKIAKASGLVIDTYLYILPVPRISQALAATASEGETHTYDAQAVGYLSAALTPIVLGFALYAFIYSQFTGWMDFILSTAVSAVYTFGFVLMTPQLWINYKLKSVAHMPWRVLGYRFFNTIIDDLFASIIKMPLISVFRDDVVFVIYMYQRFLYRVDTSRPSEGFDVDESAAEASENLRQREAAAAGKKDK